MCVCVCALRWRPRAGPCNLPPRLRASLVTLRPRFLAAACAQLVKMINAKCAEVDSLALQLEDSKGAADSALAQLDTARRLHRDWRERCSIFLQELVGVLTDTICEVHSEQRQHVASEADHKATQHENQQLREQLAEKQSVVEALQRQLSTCEDSLTKALAAANISAEQASLHKENMQQDVARMAREMDELRTKDEERLAAMHAQSRELSDANQRVMDGAAKIQRLELEAQQFKDSMKTRDKQMLDMTDKVTRTKEQWVLEKEAMDAALKSANDKYADTKKQMAALRDLKLSFADRAKEAEAAQAAAEHKLAKALKELQSLRPGIGRAASSSASSASRTSPVIQPRGAKTPGRLSNEASPANKEASRTERMRHLVLERDDVSERLRVSEQALAELKARLTVVERVMQEEREQKEYLAEKLAWAQQSIEAGVTPLKIFQTRPHADAEIQQKPNCNPEGEKLEREDHLQWTISKCEDGRTQNSSLMDEGARESERVQGLEARLAESLRVAEERAKNVQQLEETLEESLVQTKEFQVRIESLQIQLAEECVKLLDEETRNKSLVQENEALRADAAGVRVQFEQAEHDRLNVERMLATAQALESESGAHRQHTLWTRINELQSENDALHRSVRACQQRVATLELNEKSLKEQLVLVQREIMECTRDLSIAHEDMQTVAQVLDVSIGEHQQQQNNLQQENETLKVRINTLLLDNAKAKDSLVADGAKSASQSLDATNEQKRAELQPQECLLQQITHLTSQNEALTSQNEALAESLCNTEACLLEVSRHTPDSTKSRTQGDVFARILTYVHT